jgi:hypothetical protein
LLGQSHRSIEQTREVGCQHLGRYIHQQNMLAQSADALQLQAVLQALERLLKTPTLMAQIGQPRHRRHALIQQDGQNTYIKAIVQ